MTRARLVGMGFDDDAIGRAVRRGFLHRLHRGIYAVGRPDVSERGTWLAAVLACGPGAVLGYWHAAALWGIWSRPPRRVVHVTAVEGVRRRRGIVAHRARDLEAEDRRTRDRIPVTSPSRTLIDLAAVASPKALAELVEEAVRLELVDRRSLNAALERYPHRRGLQALRRIAARIDASAGRTRSRLEALYLLLCREQGLPAPLVNESVAGMEVDALFPEQRVVVELDSYGYHGAWSSRQRDHQRAARLSAAGCELLRFDWEQVTSDPDGVHAATAAALRRSEHRPRP